MIRKLGAACAAVALNALVALVPAQADSFSPFGSAVCSPSSCILKSTTVTTSGVFFTPGSPLTFADVTSLSANFTDTFGGAFGGSPRFNLSFVGGGDMNIVLGTSPGFSDSVPSAFTTAYSGFNVIGNNDAGRYDTSHLAGGNPFTTYSSAFLLVGSLQISEVAFIVDGGWGGLQKLQLNSIDLNGTNYGTDYTSVPGPIAGAGIPGLVVASGALIALARRRKARA